MIRPDDPVGDDRVAQGRLRWKAGDKAYVELYGWVEVELVMEIDDHSWLCVNWNRREFFKNIPEEAMSRIYKRDNSDDNGLTVSTEAA